jgi:DNA phosphorothioation-dependent restriction protein DptG
LVTILNILLETFHFGCPLSKQKIYAAYANEVKRLDREIRGDLWNVLTSHEERVARSNELFRWMVEGKLTVSNPTVFALRDGNEAHRYLESRKSRGKILLIP